MNRYEAMRRRQDQLNPYVSDDEDGSQPNPSCPSAHSTEGRSSPRSRSRAAQGNPRRSIDHRDVPSWWPRNRRSGERIDTVFRAMTVCLSEILPLESLPKGWICEVAHMEPEDKLELAKQVFLACNKGSWTTSPFVHVSLQPKGALFFQQAGQRLRGERPEDQIFCRISLYSLWRAGYLRPGSFF